MRIPHAVAAIGAVTAALAAAPSAFAIDYCVGTAQCSPGNTFGSVQTALGAAQNSGTSDRLLLGSDYYSSASGFTYAGDSTNTLNIVGAGEGGAAAGGTTLATFIADSTALKLSHAVVSGVRIEAPQIAAAKGYSLDLYASTADHVAAYGSANGVVLGGQSVFSGGKIEGTDEGLVTSNGGGSVSDSSIIAPAGSAAQTRQGGPLKIERSRLEGWGGLDAYDSDASIDDSLVILHPDTKSNGLVDGVGLDSSDAAHTVTATNVTVIGDGGPHEYAAAVQGNQNQHATLYFENSVAVNVTNRFYRRAFPGSQADVIARYDDLPPVPDLDQGGTGAIDASTANLAADPAFADPAAGDYRLTPGSPLVDQGTNTPQAGLAASDRDGNDRALDGDGDGTATADIGAYESPAVPLKPPVTPPSQTPPGGGTGPSGTAPVISRFKLTAHRRAFRFRLSQKARVRIRIVRIVRKHRRSAGTIRVTGKAGANRVTFRGRIGRKALRSGRYQAVARATDAAGRSSAVRRLKFSVRPR